MRVLTNRFLNQDVYISISCSQKVQNPNVSKLRLLVQEFIMQANLFQASKTDSRRVKNLEMQFQSI